ncbi:MAG TPA: hypothetical protein VFQ88_06410 [Nevskiaceae bacterium]|nr:hypothetical protein [Nevskiaceae bacterium]
MNGIHDLGGMHGMGPIVREANEPPFHSDWERKIFALQLACSAGGHYNVDMFRRAIESMPPAEYLESSYYEHWLFALEALMIEDGSVTRTELDAREAELRAAGVT